MNLSKERRIYLAILGLGLAGVAADRLWLRAGPSSAGAAVQPEAAALAVAPTEQVKSARVIPVSRRLEEIAPQAATAIISDAFVVPAAWQPVKPKEPPQQAQQEAQAAQAQAKATAAARSSRVTGLVGRGDSMIAVIDGEVVSRHQDSKVSGMRLVRVEGNKVTITRDGKEETLEFVPSAKER